MIRTDVLRKKGKYYDRFAQAAEDYELVRRLAQGHKVANLPDYLIDYTLSLKGISLSKRKTQLTNRLKIQWTYRCWTSPHFYAGILKTLALWYIPVPLITALKKKSRAYRPQNVRE